MQKTEAIIQRALIHWLRVTLSLSEGELKIAASQNENSRHATVLGTDIGEPDLRLSLRHNDVYYILYLELKTKKARLRNGNIAAGALQQSQIDWNKNFDENYACDNCQRDIACGFEEAKKIILVWLNRFYVV